MASAAASRSSFAAALSAPTCALPASTTEAGTRQPRPERLDLVGEPINAGWKRLTASDDIGERGDKRNKK
eukprot:scaffold32901_cov118-Isochrysis_galbana.AAC.1